NDEPRRVCRRRLRDRVLVRAHVLGPELPFAQVRFAELPRLLRLRQSLFDAAPLFVAAEVEEELDDDRAVIRERLLERVDLREALPPNGRRDGAVNALDEHAFVVAA